MPQYMTLISLRICSFRVFVDETLQREDVTATQREELKGSKYVALYKAQYVLNHTKGQMAIPLSDEDKEYVKLSAAEAAALYPDSDNSRLQDFESSMMEDDVDRALQLVEEGISAAQRASDAALESAYTLYKANAVSTKVCTFISDSKIFIKYDQTYSYCIPINQSCNRPSAY